jgi:hypothetical protein
MINRSRTAIWGRTEPSPRVYSKILFRNGRNTGLYNSTGNNWKLSGIPGLTEKNDEYIQNFTGYTRWPKKSPHGGLYT